MKFFEETLQGSDMMQDIYAAEQKGQYPIQLNGCVDTQICHMMTMIGQNRPLQLIVTYNEERAKKLYDDCRSFGRDVYYYPPKDALFFSADVHGAAIQNQRLEVVRALLLQKRQQEKQNESPNKNQAANQNDMKLETTKETNASSITVVTTIDGVLDRLLPLSVMEQFMLELECGQTLDLKGFAEKLVELGYEKSYMVEHPGQFAIRGGIVDIFPMGEDAPYRLEMWDDEIDTIRAFDVESQRSIEQMEKIWLFPATEMPLSAKVLEKGKIAIETELDILKNEFQAQHRMKEVYNISHAITQVLDEIETSRMEAGIDSFITYFYDDTVSLLDYFSQEKAVVFFEELSWITETLRTSESEFEISMQGRLEAGHVLEGQKEIYFKEEEIFKKMRIGSVFYFSKIGYNDPNFPSVFERDIHVHRTNTYQNHFDLLVQDMQKWEKEQYRIVLLSASSTRAKRIAKDLEEEGLQVYFTDQMHNEVVPGQICVTTGNLSCGFLYIDEKIAILSEDDVIKQKPKKRRVKPKYKGEVIKNFDDLSVGDYVVQEDRGVGIYRGIVQREVDGIIKDYIAIEYAEGAMYYINVSGMDKVQRFASNQARKPKLNKLGGKEWEKTKSRVRTQVGALAKELVQLYAIRQQKKGFACTPDTVWQTEFEEMFPYEETEDQLKAIAETKTDMESAKIMDRLICGDVGYGKTEIALRAAFKAVSNSKQVVYLVPTTVLAEQHFQTFTQRMKDFPIGIRMLSRFCTAKQQKETIEGLKNGSVDIVIGTHKVFSKNVEYHNLGLLIIDEEQRFGVAHKEKIKQMKKDVDVLTLSATPIPRTLHMSLSGIRDMSLLNEAPVNRHAIQTYVMEYNEELVKEAIKREIARGGQVYYVFNRVKNIVEMASVIQELVPGAKVAYGHGQMSERELEKIMMEFNSGNIDVLVSTTIIETGLDIPNVNTIIIHDADTFGLSQLYQLRGRVGRSSRRAFAFLLYRRDKMIKETAQKRLAAIREFTDLGSGFKIAMRDLEIRGAGNVLGEDQSGHMEAVGYDLYCKMLNQAIAEMRGEMTREVIDTVMEINVTAYIPANYVRNEFQKLELYKRISAITNREELEDMVDELIDRYGELPEEVHNLVEIALMKNVAAGFYITKVQQTEGVITLYIYSKAPVDRMKMHAMLKEAMVRREKLKFQQAAHTSFILQTGHLKKEEILDTVWSFVNRIGAIMEAEQKEKNESE